MANQSLPLSELVETIKTYLGLGENLRQTAISLGVAPSTVHRRLNTKRGKKLLEDARQDIGILDQMEKDLENQLLSQYQEIAALRQQIRDLTDYRQVHVKDVSEGWVKIGVMSDVHKGSLYHQAGLLELAYDVFEQEEISDVYVAGDLVAGGKMYRGQEFELWCHGVDAQVDLTVNSWPEKSGITTNFITGNHDLSFHKNVGVDIGKLIPTYRKDFVYLGREEADVHFTTEAGKARVRLVHPGKGTAYAMSYHPQKYIEALEGGKKPHIILMGHYHKADKMPQYRNVCLFQTGCIESQTPFMRRNNLAAHMGFWIVEFLVNEEQMVSRVKSEFVSWFGKQV